MLGNPNTPQGERSLEDTEKESEEEGATAGAGEEMWMEVFFLGEWAQVSGACAPGTLWVRSTALCRGSSSPSSHPGDLLSLHPSSPAGLGAEALARSGAGLWRR